MDIIENVYKSFLKAGFSPKQAKALTAEVGRENNFNSKYVYGSHQDAANNKTNVGFFSWQGERGKELVSNLKNKGLYKNNRIVESQEALDEMAKYTMYEIQNKGAYKKTKEKFLSNPDISQNDAAEVLGRDFIRWDMDGKHINNVADHKRRRDNFYNKLNTNQYKTTEIKASKETEEQTPYINPIDFNTPEYSGMTFSEEEPEQEQTPQQASQDLLEESFLEEADAMLAQSQTQQEQPVQDYAPSPQYNVELAPIEYQPIAQFQDGGELPDPVNGITYDPNGTRTYYDSRLDRIVLTPQSAFAPKSAVINHEKFHKKQYNSGRSNFDIAHSTENKLWAQMQKPPQLMTTDEEYYNYHNRKSIESNIDIDNLKKLNNDFRFVPNDILYNKIVDSQQYINPYSLEGEATEYENSKLQKGGKFAELDAKMAKTKSQLNKSKTPQLNLKERPKEVVRENTQTTFRNEAGRQVNTNPNQQISTKHINERRTESQIIADRKKAIDESLKAQDESIIGSPNWRQTLATQTQSTGDKFRIFPNEDSFIDNYLNPAVIVGDMARNLGQAPLQAQQQDSYMPYVTSIGMPLAVGAMAGYGTQGNTQFVNNIVNPLAGTGDILKKGINYVESKGIPLRMPAHIKNDPNLHLQGITGNPKLNNLPKGYTLEQDNNRFWLKHNDKEVGQIEYMKPAETTTGEKYGSINIEIDKPHRGKGLSAPMYDRILDYSKNQGHSGIMSSDVLLQSPEQTNKIRKYFKGNYSEDTNLVNNVNESIDEINKLTVDDNRLYGENEPLLSRENRVYLMTKQQGYKQVEVPIKQDGGQIPVSSRGVYDFPNQEVIVPTEDGEITMKNINYPIIGTDEFGNRQLMQPDGEYKFPGKIIHEIPQTKRLKNKRFK